MMRRISTIVLLLTCGTASQAKGYDFAQPPGPALETLAKLKHLSTGRLTVTADERALFADAADGKLDQVSFAEAALLASGVTDNATRKACLSRIDQLETGARQAVAGAKTTAEKGEKLLQFLHAGVMKPGYSTKQTALDVLLDTGKFNCVSSAVLFNILAQRLGLDARGVLVHGHAFSVVYDGSKAMDVETTNARGFNPRDPAVLQEIAEKTGKKPASGPRDRREVRELGLVASIYANRSADLSQEKRYYESLLCGFAALALDPASDTGVQNAKAGLANWSKHLIDTKQFETALVVIAAGQEVAPKDYALKGNREACWQKWLEDTHAAQGEAAAQQLAGRLLEANAGNRDLLGIVRGHVGREMKKLHAAGQFEQALVLVRRHRDLIGDQREFNNLKAYCYQEWIKAAGEQGEEAASQLFARLLKENSGDKELQEAVRNHVIRGMNQLKNDRKYEEALAYVGRQRSLLGDEETRKLRISMYDAWAMSYRAPKNWQAGIDVYQRALKEYAGDRHLTNNLKYFEQESKK